MKSAVERMQGVTVCFLPVLYVFCKPMFRASMNSDAEERCGCGRSNESHLFTRVQSG
jgi:hypothetical protein